MLCPLCTTVQKKTTKVRKTGITLPTLDPKAPAPAYDRYWDANDAEHVHDSTVRVTSFKCSYGHEFTVPIKTPCPVAGCTAVF